MNEQQRGELSNIATLIHNESSLLQKLSRDLLAESICSDDADQQIIIGHEAATLAAAAVKIRQFVRMIEPR